jgi:SAM-dependent methyltransferase
LSAEDTAPWYERAFRSDYRLVYAHRDLESARREVAWLVGLGLEGRVLDLCCGFGRHALALSESGLDVVGVDLSMELLRGARDLPGWGEHLAGRLVRADAGAVPFSSGSFDGVVVLFSSFGYFGEEGDGRMADEIARVLRPRGRAVLDLMNPDAVIAGLVPHSRREGDGFVLEEWRSLDEGARRVRKDVELRLADGEVRRWREDVRMYREGEVLELLSQRGLAVEALYGDFGEVPFAPSAPRMIVQARKVAGYTRRP